MATLKDIAQKSGFSISTVSYALNDHSSIPEETKKKIWEVAKEVNYYPNASARNLKKNHTDVVGVFISGFEGPAYHQVLDGINIALTNTPYTLFVLNGREAKKMAYQRQVDIAITFDDTISDEDLIGIADSGTPVLTLDRILNHKNMYHHIINNQLGMLLITNYLLEQGYQKFAYLSGPVLSHDSNNRYKSFLDVLKSHHIDFDETKYKFIGEFTIQSGYQSFMDIYKKTGLDFEVLVCGNDEMAIGAIQAANDLGIKIPEDLSITGFDNILLTEYFSPRITTIAIDRVNWGKEVAKLAMNILNNKYVNNDTYEEISLIIGATTKS
ncbi:LacI family DNA-binding transcriptional regulator [Mycoplasmatota bacterium]|nr:LacI family DNA-binding transcriptional regulator [Mycoplasmatota bacterium]